MAALEVVDPRASAITGPRLRDQRLYAIYLAYTTDPGVGMTVADCKSLIGSALMAAKQPSHPAAVAAVWGAASPRFTAGQGALAALPFSLFVSAAPQALGEALLASALLLPPVAARPAPEAARPAPVAARPAPEAAQAAFVGTAHMYAHATDAQPARVAPQAALLPGVSYNTAVALAARPGAAAAPDAAAAALAAEVLALLRNEWSAQGTTRAPWAGQVVIKPAQNNGTACTRLGELLPRLCASAEAHFAAQPRVLRLSAPVAVLGDTHGNLAGVRDFFEPRLWRDGAASMHVPVLFLGDYVDRGYNSPELVAYLFAHALLAPNKFFLLRGNHEDAAVNGHRSGGASFLEVCEQRYNSSHGPVVWRAANAAFACMPLAARITGPGGARGGDVFCAHGGIARLPAGAASVTGALEALPRGAPVARGGVLYDTLWNDPANATQEAAASDAGFFGDAQAAAARLPPVRGGGPAAFATAAVDAFCAREGVALILRGHSFTAAGVALCKGGRVLTVFSDARDHGAGANAAAAYVLVEAEGGKLAARPRVCARMA